MSKPKRGPRKGLMLPRVLQFVLLLSWPVGVRAQQIATATIVGLDYAYQVPTTIPAGLTAFAFENHGKVRHELVIVRLRAGATLDSVIHSEPGPAQRRFIEIVGILVAEPGGRPLGRLLVDLAAGHTYVIICNYQDAPDKPRHLAMGMVATVEVK